MDDNDTHNPGYKYNEWEMRGTPVRLEFGAKDFTAEEVRVVVRHSGRKFQSAQAGLAENCKQLLNEIHQEMYNKALEARETHLKNASNWDEFMQALNNRDIVLADWCDEKACEERVKDQSKE